MLISRLFGKNWRTTAAGMLAAAVDIAIPLVTSGAVDNTTLARAAGLAAIGYLAKDAGQSGIEK